MLFQFLVCQLTCAFFLHKSQYVSTSKMCVSIDVHLFFVQVLRVKTEKLAKTLSNIYTGWRFRPRSVSYPTHLGMTWLGLIQSIHLVMMMRWGF